MRRSGRARRSTVGTCTAREAAQLTPHTRPPLTPDRLAHVPVKGFRSGHHLDDLK
jgi:hypothetical protein